MVHGHYFNFKDAPELNQNDLHTLEDRSIHVRSISNASFLDSYTLKRPWVPLSGREGRYFSKTPFEEADKDFSWGLEIKELLTLVWVPEAQSIYYTKGKHYTPERLRFWIYHTFFPIVMELNRTYHMLHVGAVEIAGKPVLFSAPSFGGKSTLTDYFIQKGHPLLSDDALGIEKREKSYCAVPAYPFHRPYREPESLGYVAKNFAKEVKPVYAVFLLEASDAQAEVSIKELKGIEKFKAFHESIFIEFPFRKKERFDFFGEMSQEIPVYAISIPWDLERLDEVYQAIVDLAEKNASSFP